MKLKSIEIENYRSILKTTRIQIDCGLTVIVGPNNEGKSNLLRALDVATECLRPGRMRVQSMQNLSDRFRTPDAYSWDVDFPLNKQQNNTAGESVFLLEFLLSPEECREFSQVIGVKISDTLPVEVKVGQRSFSLNIRKQRVKALDHKRSIKLAKFVEDRFQFQYIEAIRPAAQSLQVVSALVERELGVLQGNDEYVAAMKVIEELEKPVLSRLSADVQKYLKQLLPSVRTTRIERLRRTLPNRFTSTRTPVHFIVDDGSATELEFKGDGIKSLVAISLMRALRTEVNQGDLVVAIEEPESHLHPRAIRELSRVFVGMAKEHQVIITTHSPLLVARGRVQANIIVRASSANPAKSIAEIRNSLGVVTQDNLICAEFMIVVEGESDTRALQAVMKHYCPELTVAIDSGIVMLDHMHGASNIPYKLANLESMIAKPILVVDDDSAGRESEKRAKECGLDSKFCFRLMRSGKKDSELEDFLDANAYWSAFCTSQGAALDKAFFDALDCKWSVRMKLTFERALKPWSDQIEEAAKMWLADWVVENPQSCVAATYVSAIRSLSIAIGRLVGSVGE